MRNRTVDEDSLILVGQKSKLTSYKRNLFLMKRTTFTSSDDMFIVALLEVNFNHRTKEPADHINTITCLKYLTLHTAPTHITPDTILLLIHQTPTINQNIHNQPPTLSSSKYFNYLQFPHFKHQPPPPPKPQIYINFTPYQDP